MDSSATDALGKEVMDALEKGKPTEALEKVQKCLRDVENTPLNVAITGESGAGKSTFINAIRDIKSDEEEGAAPTGVVETTMKPTPYCHPMHKSVIYWDLPGTGTPKFSAKDYLKKVDFRQYDFFIIIAANRFKENDILLAQEIQTMKKKFYFVRSKIDMDVYNTKRSKPKSFNEKTLLDEIRMNCVKGLKEGNMKNITDKSVFLISASEPNLFDFTRLLETFEDELPSHKRYIYLCALPNISAKAIDKKKKALQSTVPWVATQAFAASLVPGLSDLNEVLSLTSHIKDYVQSFGLDEKSLNNLAQRSGKSNLKELMSCPFVKNKIDKNLVRSELKRRIGSTAMTVKSIVSWIPLVNVASAPASVGVCAKLLFPVIEEIAEDAKVAFETAFVSSD